MRPISDIPQSVAAQVKVLFCDGDDMLTSGGRLPAAAYYALEDLHHIGVAAAPITGRLDAEPTLVAKSRGGAGFVEIASIIIAAQNQ